MSDRKVANPELWDRTLPEAFEDFKEIDFNQEKFSVPIIRDIPMDSNEILSICMLYSLNQRDDMDRFRNPQTHLEKFRRGFHEWLEGEDLDGILANIENSENNMTKNFTGFVNHNISVENVEDTREIWREIILASVIYSLDSKLSKVAMSEIQKSDSIYEVVTKIF